MTADRDDLAAILNEHLHASVSFTPRTSCACGWSEVLPPSVTSGAHHRAHVAQMVLDSDWLRERDASKWAEGVQYMAERCVDEHGISATYRLGDNPYRADRVDAEDTDNTTDRT